MRRPVDDGHGGGACWLMPPGPVPDPWPLPLVAARRSWSLRGTALPPGGGPPSAAELRRRGGPSRHAAAVRATAGKEREGWPRRHRGLCGRPRGSSAPRRSLAVLDEVARTGATGGGRRGGWGLPGEEVGCERAAAVSEAWEGPGPGIAVSAPPCAWPCELAILRGSMRGEARVRGILVEEGGSAGRGFRLPP